MRWQFKVLIVAILGFICLDLATSRGQFFGGNPFGLLVGVKDGRTDPAGLLRRAEVRKELRLKADQDAKIDAAIWKALAEALDPDQLKRLKEIDLQQRDYKAFGDPEVQETLKLSASQKGSIKEILADSEKEEKSLADLKNITSGGFGAFQGIQDKIKAVAIQAKERCTDVLTNAQKRMWQEMVGDDFKLEGPKMPDIDIFGKGGIKGGAGKKGKAAKG